MHRGSTGERSARTSEAAGPGHGELRPLPDHHGSEESWKASERYLKNKTLQLSIQKLKNSHANQSFRILSSKYTAPYCWAYSII